MPMKSNPSKKRAPTLNDATSLKLVPSVTTILAIVHSQTLQAWNLREVMFAAWKLLLDTEGPRRQAEVPKRVLPNPAANAGDGAAGTPKAEGDQQGTGKEGAGKEGEKENEEEIEVAVVEDTAGIKLEDIDVDRVVEEVDLPKQTRRWDLSTFIARVTKLYLEKVSEAPNKGKAFHTIVEEYLLAKIRGQNPDPWPERYRDYQMLFDEWMVTPLPPF